MPHPTSSQIGRITRVVLTLVALSAVISVRAAEQPAAAPSAEVTLARAVEARFDVVPLRDGIALSGRTVERRVEISRGVILSGGQPLSGNEVRRRFGADADLVLRLSYLDHDTLQRLFAKAAVVPTPPVAPPAPAPVLPAAPVAAAPPPPPATPAPVVFDRPRPSEAAPVFHRTGARISVAKSVVVGPDEEVTDGVFAAGGSVRIEGRVRNGVVVLGGDLELAPTADVRGDLTVMGGALTIADGAKHAGAVHHGVAGDWPRLSWPSLGWSRFEPGGAARWLPLAGTTARLLVLALAMALLAFVAQGRLTRIGAAAVATPFKAALVGVAAQLLFIPLLILLALVLAITIVGIPFVAVLVPLAAVTMLGAMLLGFTSLAQRLGQTLGRAWGWPGDMAVAAALAGLIVIVLPTVAARLVGVGPDGVRFAAVALLVVGTVVEYAAWTIGLGAAIMTGLGRWAVVPPPVPPGPPVSIEPIIGAPSAI